MKARVTGTSELPLENAKWITLKEIKYDDQDGNSRRWEVAERKTRGSAGIDAVAILAILRPKSGNDPLSTIIIEQYRPPIDNIVIELPAGLIDEGEDPETAAIRELEEETGLKGDSIIESSPVTVCDPGMTTANMKLVIVNVPVESTTSELPVQKLEPGEHIVRRVVPLTKLNAELKEYGKKGYAVDSRLSHFATGWELAHSLA